jgi:hypothetical protein
MTSEEVQYATVQVMLEAMVSDDCYQSHGTNSAYQRDQKHLLHDVGLAYAELILALSEPFKGATFGAKVVARTKAFESMLKVTMGTKASNAGAHRDKMMAVWDSYLVDLKKLADPKDEVSLAKIRDHGSSLNKGLSKRYGGLNAVVRETVKGNVGALRTYFESNPDAANLVMSIASGL